MGSPEEDDTYAPSGSFLNLRLGDNGNSALPPLAPTLNHFVGSVDHDHDTHSALQTGMSTASMYGSGLDTKTTSDGLGSKVSLWDLRCDIISLLDSAQGAPTAEVSIDVLERMRSIMHDHVRHRKVQRGLAMQAKVCHLSSFAHGAACAMSVTYSIVQSFSLDAQVSLTGDNKGTSMHDET